MELFVTNKQLIEILKNYERSHPVEEYRFFDWNVWPLLREDTTMVSATYFFGQEASGCLPWKKRIRKLLQRNPLLISADRCFSYVRSLQKKRRIERTWDQDWEVLSALDPEHNDNHIAPGRDVVILTLSERRLRTDHGLYEVYADPLVELFNKWGVSNLVWERGEERGPRCLPSAWTSRLLEKEQMCVPALPPLAEPSWFRDFVSFSAPLLGREQSWAEVQARIIDVQRLSMVFEQWLRQTKAKLLISVCWYGSDAIAATLAARRLGIVSVDLQHGFQGAEHDAYSGWVKIPSTGYEIVPDAFWCWGKNQASQLMENNPAFAKQCKALVCGNLWLNKWRYSDCSYFGKDCERIVKLAATHKKTILVTLQHGGEFTELIIDAVTQSPDEWLWLLRFHPATPQAERSHFESRLGAMSRTNFEHELSSRMALYALMQQSNVHVTGHSTCAQEALCFGVPTVTITGNGASAYKEFIDGGTMRYAGSAPDLLQAISGCETIDAEKCRNAGQDYFASQNVAEEGILQLLSMAGIGIKGHSNSTMK
jgi:hypothetical protein